MAAHQANLYSIPWAAIRQPILRYFLYLAHSFVERVLGLTHLNRVYYSLKEHPRPGHFPQQILLHFRTLSGYTAADYDRIPATGALAITANHPFGAMEGLALLELIRRKRKDVKVLANYILARIPELRDDMFFVDPFGGANAKTRNIHAMRQALIWLREGHSLIVFPAGEVASFAPKAFRVRDPAWHVSMMTLFRRCGRDINLLPVYIPGSASLLFHLIGKIHPRLRTILLPREMLRLKNRTVTLHVGTPIRALDLFKRVGTDEKALQYLRFRTYLLAGRRASALEKRMQILTLDLDKTSQDPVIKPISPLLLEQLFNNLPPDAKLLSSGDFEIYVARGETIPEIMREIGRLREITFRAIGEGTGKASDADDFDSNYYQVILWHRKQRSIIGCYRLGLATELMAKFGERALYTRTLFKFNRRWLDDLPGPAIELGRSFIRPEYQKTFAPLLLLWRGVLTFIAKRPHYTVLFGPVSISHDFHPASRDLLIDYLRATAYDADLAWHVSARLPPKTPRFAEWMHPDYAAFRHTEVDLFTSLSEIEEGKREMPVLIRQYLKLGGRIVAFNVDPDFGTVVDGLIVVDLLRVPPRDLMRYMGPELYDAYIHAPRKDDL